MQDVLNAYSIVGSISLSSAILYTIATVVTMLTIAKGVQILVGGTGLLSPFFITAVATVTLLSGFSPSVFFDKETNVFYMTDSLRAFDKTACSRVGLDNDYWTNYWTAEVPRFISASKTTTNYDEDQMKCSVGVEEAVTEKGGKVTTYRTIKQNELEEIFLRELQKARKNEK